MPAGSKEIRPNDEKAPGEYTYLFRLLHNQCIIGRHQFQDSNNQGECAWLQELRKLQN